MYVQTEQQNKEPQNIEVQIVGVLTFDIRSSLFDILLFNWVAGEARFRSFRLPNEVGGGSERDEYPHF